MSGSAPKAAPYPSLGSDGQLRAAALWERMLDNVPTLLGKLVSVASFREAASGEYRHPNLDRALSPDVASRSLRESHERLFAEWMGLFPDEQAEDLHRYIDSLRQEKAADLLHRAAETLVPASANEVVRQAFVGDLQQMLATEKPSGSS